MKISVVTPVYNAVNIVDELYKQLVENVSKSRMTLKSLW